jgi:LacI family sucrose operon transcriptional repressor
MTINEIAQMANVSRATVSRYLNDGYVSEEKRHRIAKVIERTGYVPSPQARTLRTGKTKFVGVIIPKISSESIGREVAGISSVLSASDYRVLLANTDNDETAEVTYLHAFKEESQVDGIILIGTVITDAHVRAIADLQIPVVVLGQQVEGVSCVYFNDYDSIYDLTLCCTHGHMHPAYIGVTRRDHAAGYLREKAFRDALATLHIDAAAAVVERGGFNVDTGVARAKKILDKYPETDAFVCATDNIAAGTLSELHARGLRVPEDVCVTGLGGSTVANVVTPSLTTAHYFYRTSGVEAARMLVEAMEQGNVVSRETKMGYRLVLGGSTQQDH